MPEIFQKTFDVKLGDEKKPETQDTYTFRAPTITFDIQVSYRAADIRRRAYPEGAGALGTIDYGAVQFARAAAIIELYLAKATTGWPFGIEDDADVAKVDWSSPPTVKMENFPADCIDLVYEVGAAFEAEQARFRTRRNRGRQPAGTEGVVGVGDTGTP